MTTSWKGAVLLALATFIGLGASYGETVLTRVATEALPSSVGRGPMDIAYGIDYEPDPNQLARLRINRPELIQYLGEIEIPGEELRVLDACDFRGNDFSTLYCLDRENLFPDDTTNLVTVNTQTAEVTYIKSFSLPGVEAEGVNGLTYDPTTGKMFAGTCEAFFGTTSTLYELDLDALTLTQIGESTEGPCIRALGTDNQGHLWATDDSLNGLEAVDKESGAMTFVGPFGFEVAFGGGMDFDASNNSCYVFVFNVEDTFRGELHRCDTDTGQAQLVGALGEQNHGEGHWGTGAIAAPSDCHVTLDLDADEVQAGDPLSVQVGIVHNRAETVSVPLALAMEDSAGNVVARRTATRKMKVGDHLDRALMLGSQRACRRDPTG